ncbi:2-alkenal reductase [Rhodopseudomonas julia]|uniref:2-alkenal reductase n=1 Tax=Rhodopseudomonas julia TaxID=200617 RepID=A0ABU0C9U4_9BRAD|nr:trypsin-like peptidase domain-containing protein [Rhodopseudomonas julia]MDQ0326405.1 2-alkenal reductase [Rhodopseudomonas julia]
MNETRTRALLALLVVLLALLLLQPYVDRLLFSATAPRPIAPRAELSDFERSSVSVFEEIAPSVVQVVARPRGASFGQSNGLQSGTGFVWDEAGHIVTNNHVVENAVALSVRLADDEVVSATLVGRAPNYDLAVLRLAPRTRLPPPVPLGTTDDLKVGQTAYAIGNPFGLDQSLTMGIISALKRRLPTSGGREIADVIQTDAAINPGNSGGPLLDSAGRLIGINTAIFSPSGANAGIGFAIPVDVANRVVPSLISSGRVPTPGIGILAADESIAAHLGISGVVIAGIVPGSPADRAGIEGLNQYRGTIGDVIVGIDGEDVRGLTGLTQKLEAAGVGGNVELTLERDGRTRDVTVDVVDIGQQ